MKTIDEIYQEMLACFGARTGLEPREGCDLSARLYALAAQVYSLYIQADWVARQAFPQTAEGLYLDYHAQLRGLERKPAVAAEGQVVFTALDAAPLPREIPRGTVCMTAGLVRFETVSDAVLEAGALQVQVPVRALEAGAAGNVSAGTILSMAVAPMGISACKNPEACAGGADGETDDALRARVLDTYKRLPNGANTAFYQQGALSFDQVAAAAVIPRPRGVGSVDVVPATLEGVPGQELLEALIIGGVLENGTARARVSSIPYREARARFEERFGSRDYFMENLMVSLFFQMHFPALDSPQELWKCYVNFCNVYSIYRFLAVMSCREGAAGDRDELFRLMVYASRTVIHNGMVQTAIQDVMFETDSATLAHMSILLCG